MEQLGAILSREYPFNLKTLILSNLKLQPQTLPALIKVIEPTDQILKLVLKDITMESVPALESLNHWISANFALQDLQLINLQLSPTAMADLASAML